MVQFSAKVRQITRVWVVTTFLACSLLSTAFSSLCLANTASDRLLSLNPALNQTSLTDPLSALAQPQRQVMPAPSIYVRDGALVIEGQAPGNPAEAFTPLAIRQQFTLSQPGRYVLDIWMPEASSAEGSSGKVSPAPTPEATGSTATDALTMPISLEQSPGYASSQIRVGRFDAETLRIVIESPTPGGLFAHMHPAQNAIHVPLSTSLISETAQWRPAYPATLQTSVLKEIKLQASPLPQLALDTVGPLPQAETRLIDWPQRRDADQGNPSAKAMLVILSNLQLPPEGIKISGSFANVNGQSWASGVLVQQSGRDVHLIAPLLNIPPQAAIEPRLVIQETPAHATQPTQRTLLAMLTSNSVAAFTAATKPQDSLSEILLNGKAGNLKKVPFPARVVIDAGHGGKDHGAIRAGVQEKELNLRMALWLRDALQSQGVTVYMTRDTDKFIPLPEITRFTNTVRPDLFISIHHNANNNASIAGLETYYYNANSKPFADRIHRFLIGSTGANDRGVRRAMFYVIHHTNVPAILCEMGYVSSPSERAELAATERPKRAVQGLASGVVDYLSTSALAQAKPQR